ncbi:MAG TPA: maleylpyruvate isomerase family mycothiol-dependent enzyme [Mycobacteriales bacterium]|nr:maleylpyruvate isomerase family mycothiol-dependent enzyme [Mycobacteriales bacterium]
MTDTVTTSALRTHGSIYEETRQRVINLVREASYVDFFAASAPTPACPGWRVRDVIAHLSGLATDIASGNLAGQATAAWTAAQVDARRNMPLSDLLAESDEVGPQLASYLDDFPGRYGAQVAADITVHEHDIRGGLGQPGARDSVGVAHGIELLLTTFVGPGARALGLPPLHIRAGQRSTVVGGYDNESTDPTAAIQSALATWTWPPDYDDALAATPSMPRLEASPFELLRAFSGRRSLAQVHRFNWTTAPAPYNGLFGLWPFTPQPVDLDE